MFCYNRPLGPAANSLTMAIRQRHPSASPLSKEVVLHPNYILCQFNTEPIGGGDDLGVNGCIYELGDIFDLL